MARCTKTWGLEVHHKNRNAGNDIGNAIVLCQKCHEATSTYAKPGISPLDFSQQTKNTALSNAGNQCQCTSNSGCH